MWLAGGLSAMAQEPPNFPASLDREPLIEWLRRETDMPPERVLAVTPQVVTSVVSRPLAGAGQSASLVIRAEALTPESHARTQALSWRVSLAADCAGRRVRLGETQGYPSRSLRGEARLLRPADADWRTPDAGTALDFAWRAACDPQFKGPFASDGAAPRPSQAVASSTAVGPAPAAGGPVAQVGAAASEAEAQALLAGLGSRLEGRPTRIERAVVNGKTWHRAVVGGFADGREAGRFCAELKAAGRGCFVRPGAGS